MLRNLAGTQHECGKRICQEEHDKMLEITRRNLDRLEQAQKETSPQEEHEEGGLERTDDEYKEWKEWRERDMKREKERNAKITASRKKEDGWALYRECTAIMRENKTKWLERSEMERVERVEQEKQERLEIARMKKGRSMAKNKNIKTKTKSNEAGTSTGRMENKKRLEGTKMMKSNLWKQRREQDGRLATVWKEIKKKKEDVTEENQPKGIPGPSPQEESESIPQEDPSNGDQ